MRCGDEFVIIAVADLDKVKELQVKTSVILVPT